MAYKNTVRFTLSKAIDKIQKHKNPELRLKGLLGIKNVVDEFMYDLSLLIGEQSALIEINKK